MGFGILLIAAWAQASWASPNVPLEDDLYLVLARLRAQGKLSPYLGGGRWLTEAETQQLLAQAGAPSAPWMLQPGERGFWLRPLSRATARLALVDEHNRPYSTDVRPRDIAGSVALSCEHQQGRPCGGGAGVGLELDSAAGYGPWLSAYTRLRLDAGNHAYAPSVNVDRAYVNTELGPVALEAGRDVLVLGPAARSELQWSDHAAPLDHVRLSTSRPLVLPGIPGSILRLNLLLFLGRLRDPQRFHGTLVSGQRAQFDLFDSLELGGTRLLQLGGSGAPPFNFREFVIEHFTRLGDPDSAGISNNRLSFDASVLFRRLHGARLYYEIDFEDLRSQFKDSLKYDADHLLGLEVAALDSAGHHGLLIEYHRTGVTSQEHSLFTTGMTNAGLTVGSPLGPDAWSFYARVRLDLPSITLSPWMEVAHFSSDRYQFFDQGPLGIQRVSQGVTERRMRAGSDYRLALSSGSWFQLQFFAERVDSLGLVLDDRRLNAGAIALFSFLPVGAWPRG